MKPPPRKVCGTAHWGNEPHRFASSAIKNETSGAVVRTQQASRAAAPELVRTQDYPGRSELLAQIAALKAENTKLKAGAEATARRRTENRDRMAARRAGNPKSR